MAIKSENRINMRLSSTQVAAALDRWRIELLDLSKGNRLLYSRPGRAMLSLTHPDGEVLFESLVNKGRAHTVYRIEEGPHDQPGAAENVEMVLETVLAKEGGVMEEEVPPVASRPPRANEVVIAGERKQTESALYRLRLKSRSALKEQGINVLYVTFGALEWMEAEESDVSIISPLALFPVRLDRETALAPYTLVPLDDGPVLNPALSRKLELDFDLSLSLPSDDDREFSLPGILAHVRQTVEDQPRWKVRADVHLGIFSFAKHAMYADLDMNVDRFSSHPVLRAISGESEGVPEPLDNVPTAEHLDQNVSPAEVFQVLDADASQQEAIAAVKAGANLVIQGPPGTGKSQTITNIIAETLGQGKTVLFVSEKMAALRVVAKRLEEARLGEFCLEAHSQDVNKEKIIRELERTLASDKSDPRQTVTDSRALIELEQLCQLRQDLNAYVRALHDANTPLGLSAFQIHGEIARRADVPVASFPLLDVGALTPQRLARLESVVLRLASVGNVLLDAAEHPWLGCLDTTFTPQLRGELSEQLELLASHAERLDAAQSPLRVAWRLPPDPTRSGAHWLSQLVDLLDDRVDVPAHWFRSPSLAPLLTTANMYRTCMADCRSRKGSLLERYTPDIFSLDLPQLQMSFSDSAPSSWSFVRGTGTPADRILAYQAPIRVAVEKAARSLTQLGRVTTDLVARLGVEPATSLSDAIRLRSLAGPALSNPRPTRAWFELGRISALRELGQEALKHQETVSTCRGQILKEFSDEFFDLATPQLLERFETKFGSWTRSLSPSYRRTLASLRRTLTQPEGLSYSQALVALKRARQVTTSQAWLDGHREELVTSFGLHYDGSNTDWQGVLAAVDNVRQLQGLLGDGLVPDRLVRLLMGERGGPAALRPHVEALDAAIEGASTAFAELDEVVTLDHLTPDGLPPTGVAVDALASCISTWMHSLQPLWSAAAILQPHCIAGTPSASTMAADVREALVIQKTEAELIAASNELQEQFGHLFSGLDTRWDLILDRLGWTGRMLDHFGGSPPESFVEVVTTGPPTTMEDGTTLAVELRNVGRAIENLRPHFASGAYFPDRRAPSEPALGDVADWARVRCEALPRLEEWCDQGRVVKEAEAAGLNRFVTCITERRLPSDCWREAFLRQLYTLWLTWRYDDCVALAQFRGRRHEEVIEEFKRLDALQWRIASNRISRLLRRRRPTFGINIPPKSEPAILMHEASKRRRFRPMRKLFADLPNLLPALKPCMLMSPLAVAQFLGESPITFDVVLFDEASQILPADAVGAICRGKQLVVVGDQQQLPPTRFFAADIQSVDDDEDEELPESILDTCVAAGMTKKPLLWHYRSRHEHLIAFSNRHFYDGRLITFPSADDTRRAVQFVHVEDGVYSRGANNRFNRVEAKKVVDLVLEHAQKHPQHTLGVITFSEAQMVAIQTEIDARKRANPVLEETLSESGPEGFFVKNLENVQGDERDAIFFSVGYGPDETGKMGMNFGPLNRQGGERRLNVAVTRARHYITIAASFRPEDIDRERTKAKGTHLLRSYLEFAEMGPQALLGEITSQGGELESPFEEAVATALMARGLSVVSQVGVSGFRIDLAIKDERRDRYLLGIECDGATYHSAKTARDRDRLRQQVLERLGWKIHRIWSTDWIKDPEGEVRKVLHVLASVRDGGPDDPPLGSTPPDVDPSEGDGHDLDTPKPISLGEERLARGRAAFLTQAGDFGIAQVYRYADLPEGRYTPYEFETGTREILCTLVLRCVEAEGPVHEDRVVRAVANVYGIGRVSARMRDRIRGSIRLAAATGRMTRRGDFLWPTGLADPPIRAADAEGNVRPIREVAPEELTSAIVSLLKTAFAMSRYDLTSAVAREMGYERTGTHVAAAIGGAIDTLVVGDVVLDIGGQLRLAA